MRYGGIDQDVNRHPLGDRTRDLKVQGKTREDRRDDEDAEMTPARAARDAWVRRAEEARRNVAGEEPAEASM